MKVETILKAKGNQVFTIPPDATIATVLHQLQANDVGALVVSADGRTIAGIVSERDISRCLLQYGSELLDKSAADVMTRHVHTCTPEDNIRHVMTVMTQRRIRHMPVIDAGRPCGMISIGDVLKNRLEEVEAETGILRDRSIGLST